MAEIKIKAEELAKKQQSISVSDFFTRNRHLLGFDNPRKALLTAIKEAVDNALDAAEEMGVLPSVSIVVKQVGENKFIVIVEDNGPGIVKEQIPHIFARLLYGSKFHKLAQSRGQQGIGISATVLYGQLTTGKPAKIISRISEKKPAHYYELFIDTSTNMPKIVKEYEVEYDKPHGTRVEIELEGIYQKGVRSIDEYLKQTAIANPHVEINYINPDKEQVRYPRATNEKPAQPIEIKPHPYGIELGILIKMLHNTSARTLQSFLTGDFCRVGAVSAKEICEKAKLDTSMKPSVITRDQAEAIMNAIKTTKISAPPTDCIVPIGQELLEKGLKKEISADFYCSTTRSPSVYRGNPFVIESALAYGGQIDKEGQVQIIRFANKVPLQYQAGACAISKMIGEVNWKPYGLQQSGSNTPIGPVVVVVHMCSVWVPFTSESKEAIAHYPEIMDEIKLALQECGRKLGIYIHKNIRAKEHKAKIGLFEKYIPELAGSLSELTGEQKQQLIDHLQKLLKKNLPSLEMETPNGGNQSTGKA